MEDGILASSPTLGYPALVAAVYRGEQPEIETALTTLASRPEIVPIRPCDAVVERRRFARLQESPGRRAGESLRCQRVAAAHDSDLACPGLNHLIPGLLFQRGGRYPEADLGVA